MSEKDSWPVRYTLSVAEQIYRRRKARGWSAQKLSNACAELGMEFPRSTLADLESGRRGHVSVAELLVLARALDVPPLLLLVPVGTQEETEVLPECSRDSFRVAQWFAGEVPFPGEDDAAYIASIADSWRVAGDSPLELYRAHDRAATAEMWALAASGPGEREDFAGAAAALRGEAERHHAGAANLREKAEALGMLPPSR